jgi:retinol dehydrogenase 16
VCDVRSLRVRTTTATFAAAVLHMCVITHAVDISIHLIQNQTMPKNFFVTGCDSGFGRILTSMLSSQGHHVFAGVYLDKSMDELRSSLVTPVKIDVTDEASIQLATRAVSEVLGNTRGLDGLVNNAGILVSPGPVEWTPKSSYEKMLEVNVIGMASVTRLFLPLLRKAQGRIVNVASIAGRVGLPTQAAYCASKFAVQGYSEVLRKEMIPWGITVHIIEPGVFSNTGLYGTWKKGFDRNWENLSQEVKDAYGKEHRDACWKGMSKALDGPLNNSNSNLVPEAMVDALTSDSPKYRYRVGKDSKYLITPLTWMGERVQDFAMTRGGSKNPPRTSPEDGRSVALNRYESTSAWVYAGVVALVLWVAKSRSRL